MMCVAKAAADNKYAASYIDLQLCVWPSNRISSKLIVDRRCTQIVIDQDVK